MVAPVTRPDYADGEAIMNDEGRSNNRDENGMTLLKKVGASIVKSIQLEANTKTPNFHS